jgi:hypothetical protein
MSSFITEPKDIVESLLNEDAGVEGGEGGGLGIYFGTGFLQLIVFGNLVQGGLCEGVAIVSRKRQQDLPLPASAKESTSRYSSRRIRGYPMDGGFKTSYGGPVAQTSRFF